MNTTPSSPAAHPRSFDDAGKLVLRVTLAVLVLFHGLHKLQHGISSIEGMLSGAGLPTALASLVYIGEVLAPLLVLIGFWTRPAALIIVGNMVVAVLLAHTKELFELTKQGGYALELQAFFMLTAVAVALLGAGRYSVGGVSGRWN